MKKAVLFDMDGVLYDSMPNHAVGWTEAMARFGIKMTARDAYMTEGMRGVETIQRMVIEQTGRRISDDEAMAMYNEKARIFALQPTAPVMPGIMQLMGEIKATGLRIGVVTGSAQRPLIARIESDFGQFVAPEHIVTAFDVSHGKPAPDPYLKGMERIGTRPEETIVVENAPLGIEAGVAAGCFTIAVNSGPLPDEELLRHRPALLYPTMQQLADDWERVFHTVLSRPDTATP